MKSAELNPTTRAPAPHYAADLKPAPAPHYQGWLASLKQERQAPVLLAATFWVGVAEAAPVQQ